MSILYDYLKILEKNRGVQTVEAKAPEKKKKTVVSPLYLVAGFILLACAGALFFLRNVKGTFLREAGKTVDSSKTSYRISDFDSHDDAPGPDYSLKGIIYNSDSPSAIIGGKLVEKNAKIGDWQVMDISPSEVMLENEKKNSFLTLKLDSLLEG